MAVDSSSATTAAVALDPTRAKIAGAIKQGAGATGTSFEYLLTTAKMESNFNPTAKASTSSAGGLFQFIDQTWLGTVKEAGGALGYDKEAAAITRSASGNYSVDDPAAKAAIMKLRDDPETASAMAGVLTQNNSFELTGKLGRRPSDPELYMAHFMGVGGAAKLINAAQDRPNASAAAMFPNAAAANQSIFYDKSGSARSVSEVYSVLASRYAGAAASPATRTALAALGGDSTTQVASTQFSTPSPSAVAEPAPIANPAYLSSFPDLRPVSSTSSIASSTSASTSTSATTPVTVASLQPSEPLFRSLFQGGDRAEPISAAVREIWSNSSALPSQGAPQVTTPRPLDLFSDRAGTFSS
jgi:hypothetical protein